MLHDFKVLILKCTFFYQQYCIISQGVSSQRGWDRHDASKEIFQCRFAAPVIALNSVKVELKESRDLFTENAKVKKIHLLAQLVMCNNLKTSMRWSLKMLVLFQYVVVLCLIRLHVPLYVQFLIVYRIDFRKSFIHRQCFFFFTKIMFSQLFFSKTICKYHRVLN